MAKKKETDTAIRQDVRGAQLRSMTATLEGTAATAAEWDRLISAMGMRRSKLDDGERFADGSILLLDDPWRPSGESLTISVHDGSDHSQKARVRGVEAHWTFKISPVPSFPPPAEAADRSRKAGGKLGALRMFSEQWPASRKVSIRVSASYLVEGKRFALDPVLEEARPKKVTCRTGAKLAPRGAVMDVDGGAGPGLLTVEYPNGAKPFSLAWSGSAKVTLTPDIAEILDRAAWETLTQFLRPKSVPRRPSAPGRLKAVRGAKR